MAPGNRILNNLLFNEELADIYLRSNDGALIPANRCVLAAGSDVFKGMLYGRFAEAHNRVVDLPFSGRVLRAILQHLHTDCSIELMRFESCDADDVSFFLGLTSAARYFDMKDLAKLSEPMTALVLAANPNEARALFSNGEFEESSDDDSVGSECADSSIQDVGGRFENEDKVQSKGSIGPVITEAGDSECGLQCTRLYMAGLLFAGLSWFVAKLLQPVVGRPSVARSAVRITEQESHGEPVDLKLPNRRIKFDELLKLQLYKELVGSSLEKSSVAFPSVRFDPEKAADKVLVDCDGRRLKKLAYANAMTKSFDRFRSGKHFWQFHIEANSRMGLLIGVTGDEAYTPRAFPGGEDDPTGCYLDLWVDTACYALPPIWNKGVRHHQQAEEKLPGSHLVSRATTIGVLLDMEDRSVSFYADGQLVGRPKCKLPSEEYRAVVVQGAAGQSVTVMK